MNIKKKALGRGLSALLDNNDTNLQNELAESTQENPLGSIAYILIDTIVANPAQPRTDFEPEALAELAASIKQQGIIQPITVREAESGKYQLISGERRLRASQIAGLDKIPAFIRTIDDNQLLEMALVENIQRQDLNSIEIAISFQRLLDECNYTQEELSSKVGKNRSTVTNFLRLLKLPPEVQIAVRDTHISMGHARALINIEDVETQLTILKNILLKGLSVRDVEQIVQNLNKKEVVVPIKRNKEVPVRFLPIKSQLEKNLGTKIDLKLDQKGKGSLTISVKNELELEKIVIMLSEGK
jgi:ParB family chromosome partitioning protein